jgi:hypothetical protein
VAAGSPVPRNNRAVVSLATPAAAVALASVLLAGCGGAGDNSGSVATTSARHVSSSGKPSAEAESSPAFRSARIYCGLYPLGELARQNGVPATPTAVARAYSKIESTATDRENAYNGCLAGLKAK